MRGIAIAARGIGRAAGWLGAAARRRPAAALVVGAVLVVTGPLLVDLYGAIPWWVHRAIGRAGFVAFVALCLGRLWQVRPGDDRPPRDDPAPDRWAALVPTLIVAVLAIPFLQGPGNLGAGDWDLNLQKYEAVRRTILDWGQFPWWDPWCRGGFPLAANPQCGVVGLATPFVLALGTSVGLRVAALGCLLIATEGARRLARLWLGEPWAAVAAGLVYGINGAILVQAVAGYHTLMSYLILPWLLYHLARLDRSPADGAWLGAWMAFGVLNGINYHTVYAALIAAVVWLRGARARSGPARRRFLAHTALAAGVFLALAGWRVATTGLVYRDFPRPFRGGSDESVWTTLRNLLARPTAAGVEREQGTYFWEATCYVGPVVLLLAAASLARGWRWWHTLAVGGLCLAAGSVRWYHPSYWLADLPLFSSMHVVSRWRIAAMLGVGLAAADVLARWRLAPSRGRRRLALVLIGAIAADYLILGAQLLPLAFRIAPEESLFPGPPVGDIVQVGEGTGYPAVLRGYGLIPMQEPLLGYDQHAPTARTWRGGPGYVGESWTDAGPIRPESWSPNRVVFRTVPGGTVYLNQNPGSWWRADGRDAFPGWRCAEPRETFAARADDRGRLVLEIRPRGLGLGLGLHLAGVVLVVSALAIARRIGETGTSGAPTPAGVEEAGP